MNSFIIILEISIELQNIYFEEYVSVTASESCLEIRLKGITRSNSYLLNVQCQFFSKSIQVSFTQNFVANQFLMPVISFVPSESC